MMKNNILVEGGFSLIELMMVVALVGAISAIAIPQYGDYVSKTRAAGAAAELAGVRRSVEVCLQELQANIGCDAGTNGIIAVADFNSTNNVSLVSITDGVIVATTGATDGAMALTWIGTPTITSANIKWINTGTVCNPKRGLGSGRGDCP